MKALRILFVVLALGAVLCMDACAERVAFSDIFEENMDGSYSPKMTVKIGSVFMNAGTSFGKGARFNGVDIAANAGKEMDVTTNPDGSVTINKFYGDAAPVQTAADIQEEATAEDAGTSPGGEIPY